MAFQVRDLHVELGAKEGGPEQLLAEVQKATAKAMSAKTPADSRSLVKEGRILLAKHKLDEAERLCNQAAAIPNVGWRLFEYTPENLRADILKVRRCRAEIP